MISFVYLLHFVSFEYICQNFISYENQQQTRRRSVTRNGFLLIIFTTILILTSESLLKHINTAVSSYRGQAPATAFLPKIVLSNGMFLICISHRVIVKDITSHHAKMPATLKVFLAVHM